MSWNPNDPFADALLFPGAYPTPRGAQPPPLVILPPSYVFNERGEIVPRDVALQPASPPPDAGPPPPIDSGPPRDLPDEPPGGVVNPDVGQPPWTNAENYPFPIPPPPDAGPPRAPLPDDPGLIFHPDDVLNRPTPAGDPVPWSAFMERLPGARNVEDIFRAQGQMIPPILREIIRRTLPGVRRTTRGVPPLIRRATRQRRQQRAPEIKYRPPRPQESTPQVPAARDLPPQRPEPVPIPQIGRFPAGDEPYEITPQPMPPIPLPRVPTPLPAPDVQVPRIPMPQPAPAPTRRNFPQPSPGRAPIPRSIPRWPGLAIPAILLSRVLRPSSAWEPFRWASPQAQPLPQPQPQPLPFPEPSPLPFPSPNPSTPGLTPLAATQLGFAQFDRQRTRDDECECEDPEKREPNPSSVVARVKNFARRMSQNSLDNLRKG